VKIINARFSGVHALPVRRFGESNGRAVWSGDTVNVNFSTWIDVHITAQNREDRDRIRALARQGALIIPPITLEEITAVGWVLTRMALFGEDE